MVLNRFAVSVACAAAAALLMLIAASAAPAADLESELEAKQSQLEKVEERKGVLTTTISGYADKIERLTAEVAEIRTREAAVRERLVAKQAELNDAVAELDAARERLARVREQLKRALTALRERLIAMYETGSPDLVSVIIGSNDLDDLAARTEYLNRLHGMDEAVVGRVRDLRDEVQDLVSRLRDSKERIENARDAIAAEKEALTTTRTTLQSHQQELVSARADREAALRKIRSHEEELDGDLSELQGKIAAQLAETGATPLPAGPIKGGSGSMIWPVDGAVVSGFGSRTINGSYEYHPGIDIAVPEGTPIRAAMTGTVSLQQSEAESGGYGNYTCLDHGGGLSTCYAHQSSFVATFGQSVSQGDIIGYTGCTGYCLGPHLHFEVRINGSVTDPMGYL
jgi:murein DD-endopeptidase MepM/ murein hydrolase activator NlpD